MRIQDYHFGATRILANPRSYPDGPNQGFIQDLVVIVESSGE
jgi:hypothetical protein